MGSIDSVIQVAPLPAPNGKIHEAICKVMAEIGGIAKNRKNDGQGYKFRGIADVTLAAQPLMAKHGMYVLPHRVVEDVLYERETKSKGFNAHIRMRIEFRFYHIDGSWVACTTTGEAMDTGDKASNKAMSAALKYALFQTFCIPEEDPEIDTEAKEPDVAGRIGPKQAVKEAVNDGPKSESAGVAKAATAGNVTAVAQDGQAPSNHPAVDKVKAAFGMNEDAPHIRLTKFATSPAPAGHGWAVPKFKNFLKKRFESKDGVAFGLTNQQIADATELVGLNRKGNEAAYEARILELAKLGRVKGDEAKAS